MTIESSILILGGGPAGGAVALGLRRLGYEVTLVSESRPFLAVEGINETAITQMRRAGFSFALRGLPDPVAKLVSWNGVVDHDRTERLVNRNEMDNGVLLDLQSTGVHVIEGCAGKITAFGNGYQVDVESDGRNMLIPARFLVEARGRGAPCQGLKRQRGEETISLLQYRQGDSSEVGSVVESFDRGWAWLASWSDGTRYLQLSLDASLSELQDKASIPKLFANELAKLKHADSFLRDTRPVGLIHARSSTPVLCNEAVSENWIRVGDAAMASDPMAGPGIAQALSSAIEAPAVINTLIQKPERIELAKRYYQDMINHHFERFGRSGRDRYNNEQRWSDSSFWSSRRSWPDTEPQISRTEPDSICISRRPVNKSGLISEEDVVVTNDQPLGILGIDGMPLAPVVRAIQHRKSHESIEACLLREVGVPAEKCAPLAQWLYNQKWVA